VRTVYADSPGAAFSLNADLDQRAVGNYLNSVNSNRSAQQSAYQARAQLAAQQRQQEQENFRNALLMFDIPLRQQQVDEVQRERMAQNAEKNRQFGEQMKLAQAELAWQQQKPNAEVLKVAERARNEQTQNSELAQLAQRIADYKNKAMELSQFKDQIPKLAEPAGNWFTRLFSGKADEDAMRNLRGATPFDINPGPEFETAKSPKALADVVSSAVTGRSAMLNKLAGNNIEDLVTLENGRYVPIKRGPMDVFTQGTGSPGPVSAAQPTATATTAGGPTMPYFRNAAEIKAAGIAPGTTIMAWNPETRMYQKAIWR